MGADSAAHAGRFQRIHRVLPKSLIEYALRLIEKGLSYEEILERLETDKSRIRLIALLDTLEYLKKGGRISKAAALAGSLLSV